MWIAIIKSRLLKRLRILLQFSPMPDAHYKRLTTIKDHYE